VKSYETVHDPELLPRSDRFHSATPTYLVYEDISRRVLFCIQVGRDVLFQWLFNLILKCFSGNMQGIQEACSGTHKLLVCIYDLCGQRMNVIVKKNSGAVVNFRKEVRLEVSAGEIE
jgi:hypothetical protein